MAYLPSRAAASLLGVKLETLYAYASRGLVESQPGAGGRGRQYRRADLDRLRARREARRGHGAVAASALRWGEPVLDSSITWIRPDGPAYRGRSAVDLAREGVAFESVAELLWTGATPDARPTWSADGFGVPHAKLRALLPAGTPPLSTLSLVMPALAVRDPGRFDPRPAAVLPRARALIVRMASALGLGAAGTVPKVALASGSVARSIARSLDVRASEAAVGALNATLVLCADHELNASAFAARVAASAGADIYAVVSAALATLSGPRHGGACDRIEALVAETARPERAEHAVHERARRGEEVPGFGHPAYSNGDPRARMLLELARELAPRARGVRTLLAVVDAMREAGRGDPTIDVGLVALAAALAMPRGAAVGLFAVGRCAGWVAHALEQVEAGYLLRPRARYDDAK